MVEIIVTVKFEISLINVSTKYYPHFHLEMTWRPQWAVGEVGVHPAFVVLSMMQCVRYQKTAVENVTRVKLPNGFILGWKVA
jgi:hypothetical protein